MTKERELLQRVFDTQHTLSVQIAYEIEELLAQPEQEPVRYEYQDADGVWRLFEGREGHDDNLKWGEPTRALYTSPPKREPLSGEEIWQGFRVDKDATNAESYLAGVALAEKHHGVKRNETL